jgi:hypothetical protein
LAKITFESPIYSLTPAEIQDQRERARNAAYSDPDVTEMLDGTVAGNLIGGARTGVVGTLGIRMGMMFEDLNSDPLNLTKSRTDVSPTGDPFSFSFDNNPESIADTLKAVPYAEWPWLLSSKSFGEFQQRTQFIKIGLPAAQETVPTLSKFAFGAVDMAALVAAGVAAEPLAIAGLGAETTLAGRAVASSSGMWRVQNLATSAAEAAATISRTNLAARWAALGVAEEAVYQAVKNGVDPLYDPDASDVMFDLTLSGGLSGVLGGAVFGRSFVRSHIEDAAQEMRRLRTVNLPGGYTVTYADHLRFSSLAAADQMLFAPSALSLQDEAARVGTELWQDFQRRADLGVADLNIPGTRTIPVASGAVREGESVARVTVGKTAKPSMGLRSAVKAASFELSLAGVQLTEEVFTSVTRALVNTYNKRLTAGAFNKAFWEEVTSTLSPEVVARLRKPAERAFIGGIDRTVQDAAQREDMVEAVWNHFRAGVHTRPDSEKSLIFQVLQEIRTRGGMVNRRVVGEVIDELRQISQNPPMKVNTKGKSVMDKNARRLAVIKIINKRTEKLKRGATAADKIYVPASLLDRMSARTAGAGVGTAATRLSTAPAGTGAADFSDVPQITQWGWERLPGWRQLGNQAARLLESANGAARLIGWHAFNARRSLDSAQAHTIFESGTMALHKFMFTFLRGYRNGFIQFALGDGVRNVPDQAKLGDAIRFAFGKRELRREFNRRVATQLRTGVYDDAVDAVNETARGFRESLNKIHELAASVGLKGFTKSAVVNYMPRLWRFDKIRRLATTEGGKQDLINLIRNSIDRNGRKIVIDGVEETLRGDVKEAATVFANRLISIAQKTENAPMTEQDQALFDALGDLLGPIKAKTGSKTPFGRGRVLLDESATIQSSGDHFSTGSSTLSIADLTNDDLPFVFRKYLTSVMGAINEKRLINAFNDELRIRGVFGPTYRGPSGEQLKDQVEVETVDQMLDLARKIGGEIGASEEKGLREVLGAIRYEPIHSGAASIFDKTLGIALPYGYLVTGGQFGLAAVGELARIIGTLGWRRTVQQMPIIKDMLTNFRNLDRPAENFSSFIDSWFSPSTDRLRRALFDVTGDRYQYDESGVGNMLYRGTKRLLDGTANIMSDISGLAPITSFTQQLTAATTLQHLYDVSRGVKRLDNATIRALGLEPEQYETLINFVGRNAQTKDGMLGARVVGLQNLDAVEMDLLRGFVDRMVTTRIQNIPTRGDFHKYAFTFVGRLLTQFRTFNLKGIDNFLLQNASRINRGGGAKVAQEISATLMLTGLIQWVRNYSDWRSQKAAGNKERADELEQTLTVAGSLRGAFTGPSEFFLISLGTDSLFTTLVDKDPVFSPYRYSGLNWYGFPGQAVASRAFDLFTDVYGATVGKQAGLDLERDITRSTLHKARLLTPFQNMPILKQYFNIAEDEIATEWNLPERQPRN